MKKLLLLIVMLTFIAGGFGNLSIAGDGPAPNSGDGISNGSGFDKGGDRDDKGAPNSGDGISDGSGFEDGARDDKGAPNFGYGFPDYIDEYLLW